MGLVKSHSNYVLKDKHQLINDGTVFERDITTIGGVNQFAPGQTPVYKSGNFIITVRDDRGGMNQYNTQKWEKGADGETWTLGTVDKMVSKDELQDDTKIVLKNDYYDFREFAYYGSLTELFRSSINDILDRFPGELYGCGSGVTIYYTSGYTADFEKIDSSVVLGNGKYISNPYGVNIHSSKLPDGANPLKFFANEGFKEYVIKSGDTEYPITEWNTEEYYSIYDPVTKKYTPYTAETYSIHTDRNKITSGTPTDTYHPCKGEKVASMDVNGSSINLDIFAWLGDDDIVYYMSDDCEGVHIRPKKNPYITDFYNKCNDFQRIILNPDTSPKYKAIFSVIKSNEYGYYRELEEFVYPTSEGGYNPSADGYYANRLSEIGEFYDEYLTDNLYRIMTHEAIKNFDWTYTREYNEGDEVEYVHGGEKIQKALRIFAREFDEQKKYIDNIKNTGRLTYDERGNVPDYFLADLCEEDGWDLKSVIPYDLSGITNYSDSALFDNTGGTHMYSQSSAPIVVPYSKSFINDNTENGYFIQCSPGGTRLTGCLDSWYGDKARAASEDETYEFMFPSQRIEYKIKPYTDSSNTYTYMDVNNEFLRRLKLNSRQIWRHKGTLEGIEMILGMFGLKSKRWIDKNESCRYGAYKGNTCNTTSDYEIIEYTQFTTPIEDKWSATHDMYTIDWINSTKTITYDYRSKSNYTLPGNMGRFYSPYQGLPVAYLDKSDGKRYLYPNFDKNEQIDGNPYFQMDGGWLAKTINGLQNFQFDVDDNIVHNPVVKTPKVENDFIIDNHKLYKETVRSIKRVESLSDLLSLPQVDLYDGIICYVANVGTEVAVIDGEVFTVEYDDSKKYVRLIREGGFIKVGGLYFDTSIVVYNSTGGTSLYSLDDKLDGYEVKAYFNGNSFVCKSGESDQYSINSYNLITASTDSDYSNYFKLNDTIFSDAITYEARGDGWIRLRKSDSDYLKINTIYNYYEGNNGHNGNLKYDSGHEYFTYFQRLFKYAEDNALFDTRCYREGYDDLYSTLNPDNTPIGFRGLIHPNEAIVDYDKYLSTDTKVHYFGNYKTRNDDNTIKDINIYGDSVNTTEWGNFYGNTKPILSYSIGGGIRIPNEIQPYATGDSVTNQIVNNKRIKIKFNMKNKFNTKAGQIELKYIDDIVMNYLTQMIPSTVITEIEYNFCEFNYDKC